MRRGRKQTAPLLSIHLHCLCCTLPMELCPLGHVGCIKSGCSAHPCEQQVPRAPSTHLNPFPWLLPPKMEPLPPRAEQCGNALRPWLVTAVTPSCSAINTTRAINKHYLSALVFLMLGHSALACGATRRLKAGFRDESKLA